jgi:hypothetical protein
MRRRAIALLAGGALVCALSGSAGWAATVRFPPHGAALFTVELPDAWRSRSAETANEIRVDSPKRDIDLSIRVSDADLEGRGLDDEVAHLVDTSFTKVEFSNLHQRRMIDGRRFVVFRGSGRDRVRGTKTPFEAFAFTAGGKTGMLFFRYRAASPKTIEAAHAIVESVAPSTD